ncbi:hypothetical protein BH11BAC3_BH11BAC3_16280 [soil metagenome]
MKKAPLPANETSRLLNLQSYDILDSENEQAYDDLTELASTICDCPISLITFVDSERQWFKARKNMEDTETSRGVAFCAHTILQNEVMVVTDAKNDARFYDNPLVAGKLNIGFYAGAPIKSSAGHNLGSVCVIDNVKKNDLTDKQKRALEIIASQVSKLLELRVTNNLIKKHALAEVNAEKRIAQLIIAENDKKDSLIAYQLHENFAQVLAATRLIIETAENSSDQKSFYLEQSRKNISTLLTQVTSLSKSIVPGTNQNQNYLLLIQDYAMQFGDQNNMNINFDNYDLTQLVDDTIGLNLYRITQNQLTISKNGGAKNISIDVVFDDCILLNYTDDANIESNLNNVSYADNSLTRLGLIKGELTKESANGLNSFYFRLPLTLV